MALDSSMLAKSSAQEPDDEAADIRFSLTALGEALVGERRGKPFRGFGPCAAASRERVGSRLREAP